MSDVQSIVSMGYTAAQAMHALAENDDNVDDAIDYLFTQGRVNKHNKASVLAKVEDASVATDDDSVATDSVTEAVPTPSFPVMAISPNAQSSIAHSSKTNEYPTPSFSLMAIKDNTEEPEEKPPIPPRLQVLSSPVTDHSVHQNRCWLLRWRLPLARKSLNVS